jgi:hypothetical protein
MFRLGDGWYVNLTLANGQMWTQANGESRYLMTPKTLQDFWIDGYGASMHFLQNTSGIVDTLIYKNIRAPRVIPLVTSAIDLSLYVGKYFSEELSTEYILDLDGQNLVLHHFRLGDIRLEADPITKGLFNSELGRIEFDKAGDQVTGLKLSGGRIRDIRFERK